MKLFLLAFFVAAALAVPIPDDSENVEVIVNGVPEGHALELEDILGIKVNEHVDGVLAASSNPLHPYTAVGIAEAAAAAEAVAAEEGASQVIASPAWIENDVLAPQPVVLPAPVFPEVQEVPIVPEPVVLPAPVLPSVVPEPVVLPAPAVPEVVIPQFVIPEPVVLPAPAAPEVVFPKPAEEVPVPAPQVANGEVFNNGVVQVQVNTPQEPSMLSALQSWFSMVLNYFNGAEETSQQIV